MLLSERQLTPIEIVDSELRKLSSLQTPQQVIAIADIPLNVSLSLQKPISLILDDIKDPGNMGTIIRTAEWFNVTDIICSPSCVDAFNPKTVQAAMGSLFRAQVWYIDLEMFFKNNPGPAVYGATLTGKDVHSVEIVQPCFLVIGNEANGIGQHILPYIAQQITIPRYNANTESLNAAIATGILLSVLAK